MDAEARKKIVAKLLSAAKSGALAEAKIILEKEKPDYDFIYEHIRLYILKKYVLPEDIKEDNLKELAKISIAKLMKIDLSLVKDLDQATPCNNATSETTKTALLLFSIQRDLDLPSNPKEYATIENISTLAQYIEKHIHEESDAIYV